MADSPCNETAAAFQPFIPAMAGRHEFTPRALIVGTLPGIAFVARALSGLDARLTQWARVKNAFFGGRHADLLALLRFALLAGALFWVGHTPKLRS
jgi:hypothetical protein